MRTPMRAVMACLFTVIPLIDCTPVSAQGTIAKTGIIRGTVNDSSLRPLASAEIVILFTSVHVNTDARGQFQISKVPAGDYLLTARRLGYHSATASVSIGASDTVRLAFTLEPPVSQIAAMNVTERIVSPRLTEFEDRKKIGAGEFFNQEDIEARNVVSISDILRQARGTRLVREGNKLTALSSREWMRCPMQVYVDGVPMVGPRSTPLDLNQLPSPKETMGIEIYAGAATLPIWLPVGPPGGLKSCGAILIWTRDGSR